MEYGNSNGQLEEHENRVNENIQNNRNYGNNAATVVVETNVSSTQDVEYQDEFGDDEDYSTEDDEDLMALYLADLYVPPYRAENEQKAKENTKPTPDLEKPSTSQEQPTNADGTESSDNDEADMKVKEPSVSSATTVAETNVSSTEDIEYQDEFGDDEDYSTEDDEDLMALYLADLYVRPYRAENEQKAKENTKPTPDLEKPSTSQEQSTNADGTESSENDEADMKVTEPSVIKMMKWLRMPIEILLKLSIRNILKIFSFARINTDSKSDTTSDD